MNSTQTLSFSQTGKGSLRQLSHSLTLNHSSMGRRFAGRTTGYPRHCGDGPLRIARAWLPAWCLRQPRRARVSAALTEQASPGDPRPRAKAPLSREEDGGRASGPPLCAPGSARGRRGGQRWGDGAGRGTRAPGRTAGRGAGRGRPGADTEGRGGLPALARPVGRTSGRRSTGSSGPAARRPRQGRRRGPGGTGRRPWAEERRG